MCQEPLFELTARAEDYEVKLGHDLARTKAVEEGTGEQWFLTPFSISMSTVDFSDVFESKPGDTSSSNRTRHV